MALQLWSSLRLLSNILPFKAVLDLFFPLISFIFFKSFLTSSSHRDWAFLLVYLWMVSICVFFFFQGVIPIHNSTKTAEWRVIIFQVPIYSVSFLILLTCVRCLHFISLSFLCREFFSMSIFPRRGCWPCAQSPLPRKTQDFLSGLSPLAGLSQLLRPELSSRPCMA